MKPPIDIDCTGNRPFGESTFIFLVVGRSVDISSGILIWFKLCLSAQLGPLNWDNKFSWGHRTDSVGIGLISDEDET